MSTYVEKQATGHHAISVQILTFRLVTLKVAHQFDVLFDVFEAFQFLTIVNNFHRVLKNLWGIKMEEKGGDNGEQRKTQIQILCHLQRKQTEIQGLFFLC